MDNNINVVFISSIGAGKTTLINSLWDCKENMNSIFDVSEDIQGRGLIKYSVKEIPYFSCTLKSDYQMWIDSKDVFNSLSTADVVVIVLTARDKLIKQKIELCNYIQHNVFLRKASFIVVVNKIDEIVNVERFDDTFVIPLTDVPTLMDKQNYVNSIFKLNNCEIDDVILTCAPIGWNCNQIKNIIIDRVVEYTNRMFLNPQIPTIAFIGKTGCGKSSTINLLCGTDLPVDAAEACTRFPIVVTGKHGDKKYNIIDLPGIAECIGANINYIPFYEKYLRLADVIVYLTAADTRAYTQDQLFLSMFYSYNIEDKNLVLGINKIDLLFKDKGNLNGIDLHSIDESHPLIIEKVDDYHAVFSTLPLCNTNLKKMIVPYSVYQNWNIEKLWENIVNNLKF